MLASLRISLLSLLDNPTEKELSDASNILKWDDAHNWDELDKMHDILWNEINCKDEWSSVTINKRTLFSATSLIKAHRFIENNTEVNGANECMKLLDIALLIGGPMLQDQLSALVEQFEKKQSQKKKKRKLISEELLEPRQKKKQKIDQKHTVIDLPIVTEVLSLNEFESTYMKSTPVILRGMISHWRAFNDHNWKDLNYLKRCAGHRTVPIELGDNYLTSDWSQSLMTLNDFIKNYIENPTPPQKGYLAQITLFDLIPSLRLDIAVPDYCSICDIGNEEDLVINAWFGPKGTVTPLHHDPLHNLLCQVVGKKYVRIYSSEYSDRLYSVDGKLSNNSRIDVENPDYEKFPSYLGVPYWQGVIEEGDMLYIPPKYWHFVKSLSVSFSVSFWW